MSNNTAVDASINDDDGSSSSEFMDDEPLLKYERLGDEISNVLADHDATAVAIHTNFWVLGTLQGDVFAFDYDGNILSRFPHAHEAVVTSISIEPYGGSFVSASLDRTVCTHSFSTKETKRRFTSDWSISCIAHQTDTSGKLTSFGLAIGTTRGDVTVLREFSFFRQKADVIVSNSDGPSRFCGEITALAWIDDKLAYANDWGIAIAQLLVRKVLIKYTQPICNVCLAE